MPSNKDQHYVPQFYLRGFGHGDSIAVFNIRRRKHIPQASIPGQCQHAYLYGRDLKNEGILASMEIAAAAALRRLVQTGDLPAEDSDDHYEIVKFIAFQDQRTPKRARLWAEMEAKIVEGARASLGPELGHTSKLRSEATEQSELASVARRALSVVHTLLDLPMKLLLNNTSLPFIASDSPVALLNPWCHGWRYGGGTGLAARGLMIVLPLSPSCALLLVDDFVYSIARRSDIRVNSHSDVIALNTLQVLGAEHNLYYRNSLIAQTAVDHLPMQLHREQKVNVQRFRAADGEELLMNYEERSDPRIRLSFAPVRGNLRGVKLAERARQTRPVAMALEKHLYPDPAEPVGRGHTPKLYRAVDSSDGGDQDAPGPSGFPDDILVKA